MCYSRVHMLQVLVIRNYEDRLRIVKDIHLNTGDETRHHRRDKMLELVGQQYYWKGQRRDICECVRVKWFRNHACNPNQYRPIKVAVIPACLCSHSASTKTLGLLSNSLYSVCNFHFKEGS